MLLVLVAAIVTLALDSHLPRFDDPCPLGKRRVAVNIRRPGLLSGRKLYPLFQTPVPEVPPGVISSDLALSSVS